MGVIKCFNRKCHYYDIEEADNCSHSFVEILKCSDGIIKKDGYSQSFYLKELRSNECFCGKSKKRGYSFCTGDYLALPGDIQRALYKRIGEGYEQAYEEAVKWLSC